MESKPFLRNFYDNITVHIISSVLVPDATNQSLPPQIYATYSNLNKYD